MKKSYLYTGIVAGAFALAVAGVLWMPRTVIEEPVAAKDDSQHRFEQPAMRSVPNPLNRELSSRSAEGDIMLPPLPMELATALSSELSLNYRERTTAVQARYDRLEAEDGMLAAADVQLLKEFVLKTNRLPGISNSQLHSLKNDVLNMLLVRGANRQQMTELLRQIHLDETQDLAMRDYALQHLASLADGRDLSLYNKHWSAIEHALNDQDLAQHKEKGLLAATSILHLYHVEDLPEKESSRLRQYALQLAKNTDAPDGARLTALQVCGKMKVREAQSVAQEILAAKRCTLPLRVAAIATLGELGADQDSVARLKEFAVGRDYFVRPAALAALNKLGAGKSMAQNDSINTQAQ